jgi:hypothetical protein
MIFVTHGEEASALSFAEALEEIGAKAIVPAMEETFNLSSLQKKKKTVTAFERGGIGKKETVLREINAILQDMAKNNTIDELEALRSLIKQNVRPQKKI